MLHQGLGEASTWRGDEAAIRREGDETLSSVWFWQGVIGVMLSRSYYFALYLGSSFLHTKIYSTSQGVVNNKSIQQPPASRNRVRLQLQDTGS